MTVPRLAMVLGDPAGIGPEIASRLLAEPANREKAAVLLVADRAELEEGMRIVAYHGNFFSHKESDSVILFAESANVFVAAGFLFAKIVGWEAYDHQFAFVLLMKFLQLSILWCVAAFGSGVHHQYFFAFEVGKINFFSVKTGHFKIVDRISCQHKG